MGQESFDFRFHNDIREYLKHIISTCRGITLIRTEQSECTINEFETTEDAVKFGLRC